MNFMRVQAMGGPTCYWSIFFVQFSFFFIHRSTEFLHLKAYAFCVPETPREGRQRYCIGFKGIGHNYHRYAWNSHLFRGYSVSGIELFPMSLDENKMFVAYIAKSTRSRRRGCVDSPTQRGHGSFDMGNCRKYHSCIMSPWNMPKEHIAWKLLLSYIAG